MMMRLNKFLPELLCLVAGMLLTLAFAPCNIVVFSIIAPAILFWCWQSASPKRAFWQGLLFGIGLYGTGISWVFISIHTFGNAGLILASFITALFVLILALITALQGYLVKRVMGKLNPALLLILAFPISWVLAELLRSFLFTGFPWLLLGDTQIMSPIAGFAPIFGVYGCSFIAATSAGILCYGYLTRGKPRYIALLCLLTLAIVGFGLQQIHWTQISGKPLSVSLIQGDIPISMKWDAQAASNIANTYADLTMRNWSDLVIWPENGLPAFPEQAHAFIDSLNQVAVQSNSSILFGLPLYQDHHYYNGAMVIGNGHGTYLKHHLVPFGEYIPLQQYFGRLLQFLQIPMSNFSAGPYLQTLVSMQNYAVAVFNCYEIAYALQVRDNSQHAAWIVTISDDSWFGHSWGAQQQQQIAEMRALETGRYILSASNDGMTSIINPQGHILAVAPRYVQTVLTGTIYPMQGGTPWQRFGLWPLEAILILGFILCLISNYRRSSIL